MADETHVNVPVETDTTPVAHEVAPTPAAAVVPAAATAQVATAGAVARLSQARADIAAGVARLVAIITVGGIVIALLFAYMAPLHWVLFRTSRSVGRSG